MVANMIHAKHAKNQNSFTYAFSQLFFMPFGYDASNFDHSPIFSTIFTKSTIFSLRLFRIPNLRSVDHTINYIYFIYIYIWLVRVW